MRSSDSYGQLLLRLQTQLEPQPDKPEENPGNTLDALWLCAQGAPSSARTAPTKTLSALAPPQMARLHELVQRRLSGTPLAHLTGRKHFMEMELLAGPDALVPRIETEILARAALDAAAKLAGSVAAPRILDVCTGSGNVALALATHLPKAIVGGCDLSAAAIDLARRNAAHLGLSDRVQFRTGDLLEPFRDAEWAGHIDLLTCNPPYISSAKVPAMAPEIADFEPAMAFDGGPFGVSILMRLLNECPDVLRPGGWVAFEVGLGQGPAMEKRLKANGHFGAIEVRRDHNEHIRAILAQRA